MRRAVFHAAVGLELAPFLKKRLGGDVAPLEQLARMECPVAIPDKSMLKVAASESTPKRIIFAAKSLRSHLSLTETQTCRSCQKRSRCRFFKAAPHENAVGSVSDVARVAFGVAQYCRIFLQHPEAYPFYFTQEEVRSFELVVDALDKHLSEERVVPFYEELEGADDETAREVLLRESRRKLEQQKARYEEKLLSLPQWMRDSLKPIPGRGMTREQLDLFNNMGGVGGESDATPVAGVADGSQSSTSRVGVKKPDDEWEWVEEGASPGAPANPLAFGPDSSQLEFDQDLRQGRMGAAQNKVVNVDAIQDLPIPKRFEHLPGGRPEKPTRRFDSLRGGEVGGVYRVAEGEKGLHGSRKPHRIDLDEVGGKDPLLGEDQSVRPELRGGYTIVDMLSASAYEGLPSDAMQYVSLAPRALEGVHRYDVGSKYKPVDPRTLEKLWEQSAQHNELPFLNRVPFDAGIGRSGAAQRPSRLPQDMLLDTPEEIIPPPNRQGNSSKVLDRPAGSSGEEDGRVTAPSQARRYQNTIVELDEPPRWHERTDIRDDTLAKEELVADEELVSHALSSETGESSHSKPFRQPRFSDFQSASHSSPLDADSSEDFRFATWRAATPPDAKYPRRPFGVLEPSVDFADLSDARRLEGIQFENVIESEAQVDVRQGAALPAGDFFRRPLLDELGPSSVGRKVDLGAVSIDIKGLSIGPPGVDVEAVKHDVANQAKAAAEWAAATASEKLRISNSRVLQEDDKFVHGDEVFFLKIPVTDSSASPARGGGNSQAGLLSAPLRSGKSQVNSHPASPAKGTTSFPSLPKGNSAGAARHQLGGLGRLKRAEHGDLTDLIKPSGRAPFQESLGELMRPGLDEPGGDATNVAFGTGAPRSSASQRDQDNAAIAMQQMLHKQLKVNTREKFPSAKSMSVPQRQRQPFRDGKHSSNPHRPRSSA